jgi:hypothetical protein
MIAARRRRKREVRRAKPSIRSRRCEISPCGQQSLPAASKSFRAEQLPARAGKNRSVRPFSRPCGENSTCAGHWPFRAAQLSVRAGENPSVRPEFDLCGTGRAGTPLPAELGSGTSAGAQRTARPTVLKFPSKKSVASGPDRRIIGPTSGCYGKGNKKMTVERTSL